MKNYIKQDPWKIIEHGFVPEFNKISESLFSIGNGYMGQRANFEESFSGDSMQGSYLAGIYYPDKTKVGWWKNGYPEYFAKVLNSVNWIGIDVYANGELVDLNKLKIKSFERVLDMQKGLLSRSAQFELSNGKTLSLHSERFCSWTTKELGAIKFNITSEDFEGELVLEPYLDFDVHNEDTNYDEQFWEFVASGDSPDVYVQSYTKKTHFEVRATFDCSVSDSCTGKETYVNQKRVGHKYHFNIKSGETFHIEKLAIICSSFHEEKSSLENVTHGKLNDVKAKTYAQLREEHVNAWERKWAESDIIIDGDVSAQQGIRFNIFQLHSTYSGDDARLNIGPKGFTGEKYGGSTYWDTEAYCLPFYMSNSDQEVARNLLVYRHKHLQKAIENAERLGFTNGAALYPMVTMNGEECHNEWEITFEEIHRNGAIAYAIFDYIRYTGDTQYMTEYGLDVLLGISRFWAQRVNWSKDKEQYVMLGVTGPNEYENNVNNNWYTNYIAAWCLKYTRENVIAYQSNDSNGFNSWKSQNNFNEEELEKWDHIVNNMFYPYDMSHQIFLQQDGFMDKEIIPVSELDDKHLPLNQNWSWDRILRSCYIKQADVLQGMYFFQEEFDLETLVRHFEFYEPITVHESSLSPCVHAILASKIGLKEKAYEMYLRTARLDLDDYNNDTEDGLHITSMAGTWLSVVNGFGGMSVKNNTLSFEPYLPEGWDKLSFKIKFRGHIVQLDLKEDETKILNLTGKPLSVYLSNELIKLNEAILQQ